MDLFGDLPGTAGPPKSTASSFAPKRLSQPFQRSSGFDLFGDLPESDTKAKAEDKNSSEARGQKRKDAEEQSTPEKRRVGSGMFEVTSFCAERRGEREDMQDAHVAIDNFTRHVPSLHEDVSRLAFFAVYDGHGGERVSKYAAEHLHNHLAHRFPKGDLARIEADMKKLLVDSYKKTDEEFLKRAAKQKPSWKDGSTATTALVLNNTVYVANVGDSKAVLCRQQPPKDGADKGAYVGLNLTKEHNPSQYEERMRIQKAGGTVREGRVMGVLEVSRSLGDGPYKRHGVSCAPDVKRCQLTPNDSFLIIACDGLWKAFTNDTAIQLVNKILKDDSIQGNEMKSAEDARWEAACNSLANEAVRRLSADNVTVILVRLRAPSVTPDPVTSDTSPLVGSGANSKATSSGINSSSSSSSAKLQSRS